MAALTVWIFDDPGGADAAVALLAEHGVAPLDGATAVWERRQHKPRTRQLVPADGAAGGPGLDSGFWGLLFGLTFYVPLLGAAIGAATGAVSASLADVGITDGFLNQVRDRVTPGTSALFLLATGAVRTQAHDAIAPLGAGEEIRTELSTEQEAALRRIFGA